MVAIKKQLNPFNFINNFHKFKLLFLSKPLHFNKKFSILLVSAVIYNYMSGLSADTVHKSVR